MGQNKQNIWKKASQSAFEHLRFIKYYFALELPVEEGYLHKKQISSLTKIKDPEAKKWGPNHLATFWEWAHSGRPKALIGRAKIAR